MRKIALIALLTTSIVLPASAQEVTKETVVFKLTVNQPSLFDNSKRDSFKGMVDDRSGTTSFELDCSAGASGFLGMGRVNEACALNGQGSIKNPNNLSQALPRINYSGGFTIEAKNDGYTDASTIKANYLRVGSAEAVSASFGGSLVMMPENPSASAMALGAALVENLKKQAIGTEAVEFNTAIDSIRFDNFTVPNVGQRDSASCSWTGDAIYAYANDAWQMAFSVKCGDKTIQLEGNMPLVDPVPGADYQDAYALNLVVPGAGSGDPFAAANDDPFAVVDGVTGLIRHHGSGRKTEEDVYERVVAEGELTGTNVPLELVRSFGEVIIVLARTFEGA